MAESERSVEEAMPWETWSTMGVFDAIFTPQATRDYVDRPVPTPTLARILRAGTFASSSGNTQPWDFVVVADPVVKARLKVVLAEGFARGTADRAKPAVDSRGRTLTGAAAVESVDRVGAIVMVFWNPDRGVRFLDEYEENGDGTLRDVRKTPGGRGASIYPACQNMLLAARALGVQSLFTTFFGRVDAEVKEILGVPPRMFLEAAIFLGYSEQPPVRARRRPLGEVTHVDRWDGPWPADVDGEV